jgi:PAS domain S-box-containing protein
LSEHEHGTVSADASLIDAVDKLYGLAPFGHLTTAASGKILTTNQTMLRWLGYTRQEVESKIRVVDLLTSGGRLFYETHLAPILNAQNVADEVALDFVCKDGTTIPTLVSARQTRDPANDIVLNRWTVFKATARRQYERDLVAARNLFETTLSSIADGVITTNVDGAITFMNVVAAELTGWDPDLAVGRRIEGILTLTREDTGEVIENPIRHALRAKTRVGLANHTVLLSKDGRRFVVDDSAAPILDEDGAVFGAVMVFRDVTPRRTAERALHDAYRQLQESAEELRRSNDDLSQFAYVASHDLRSPLKTVALYSQLLQRKYAEKLGDDGKELVAEIAGATKRMGALIEDLLQFSTLSSKREYSVEPIEAETALQIVAKNLRSLIIESGAVVDWGPLPKLGIDETSLIQVFQNLVANAIRYRSSAPPHIHVCASQDAGFWHFECRDNGVGVPVNYSELIFEPFKRLHGDEIPGSGIGLAVCKKIVERYGGRIWVQSVIGEGSTFHFTLPITRE